MDSVKRKPPTDAAYIVIEPSKGVRIEGCRQLIECSEVLARVKTKQYTIEILGSGLHADVYGSDSIEIGGSVLSVSLEINRKGGGER